MDRQPIISAKDVEITFSLRGRKLNAIRKCSLDLYDGETDRKSTRLNSSH